MSASQFQPSPARDTVQRILPFDSGAEEELVTSMEHAPFSIDRNGKPSVDFKRWGRDTIQVHMRTKVTPSNPDTAGFSIEVAPLRDDSARFNLSSLDVRLVQQSTGLKVPGFSSDDGRILMFFPLDVGSPYNFEFGETLGVLVLPERPKPPADGPLKAREKIPVFEPFSGGAFAVT